MPPAKKSTGKKRGPDNQPAIPESQLTLARAKSAAPTSAADWKKSAAGYPLEVPSGNTALVKRVGLQAFVKEGIIPNSLMPMVTKAINTGTFDTKEELGDIDAAKLNDIMKLYDAVTVECVIQPRVIPAPVDEDGDVIPFSLREETEDLYVDEVDFNDKVFIFQFVTGGTSDVASFRAEQDAVVDSLRTEQGVDSAPERPTGTG
jgi:hypothetical protein